MTDSNVSHQTGVSGGDTDAARNGIVDKVRSTAAEQLTNQKKRATDGLGTVAQAVRSSTRQLRNEQHDTIARYAEQAADQIDRLSQRLRDKDVAELMRDIQQVARRQPALFIGGAFALGLMGARFFKSSSSSGQYDERRRQAGTSGPGPGNMREAETAARRSYEPDYSASSASSAGISPGAGVITEDTSDMSSTRRRTAAPGSRTRRGTQGES